MSEPAWSLHPQLAQDCRSLGDLPLCRVLLMNDATYPWLILVPRRYGLVEIIDLDDAGRTRLMAELALVSAALRGFTRCNKLNTAALGNAVPQLHVHVIARFRTDPAWPRPVWGVAPAQPYADQDLTRVSAGLRRAIGLSG